MDSSLDSTHPSHVNLLVVNPSFRDGMAESARLAGAPHAFHEAVIRHYHSYLARSNVAALHLPRHDHLSGEKRKSVEDESLDSLLDVQFKAYGCRDRRNYSI